MLIDGKKIATEIQSEIEKKVTKLDGRKPGLAFILVGDNPASKVYVQAKRKACASTGISSTLITLPHSISESDLLKQIDSLNQNPEIDGILVQLPLPPHIQEKTVTFAIDPRKDVDGFHPLNVGKMLLGEEGGFFPCTPLGIQVLLQKANVAISGKHVVIVGRSNLVGKPLAAILMQKKVGCNATVTVAHSQSEKLKEITRTADILVAAVGKPKFITKEMVSPKSCVIDVGINRDENGKIVGDVDFESVEKVAEHITPVPGGVGPMTIAMLLQNTLKAFFHLSIFLFLLASCQKPKDTCTYFEGTAMTMPYRITIGKGLLAKEQKKAFEVILETFDEVHTLFDNWNPDSEISRINLARAGAYMPLSPPMQNLLDLCDTIVILSGGRFDPTIEPLARLWRETKEPSPALLQKATDALGWNHIFIQNGILRKDYTNTKLDLSAIAKGICVDWLIERLQKLGYMDLMVEWGADVRATGIHPETKDWVVQINPALQVQNKSMAPIPLRNAALATSYNKDIIDPLTASPLEKTAQSIASVSVIAPTCALADALSTSALLFHTRKEAESWAQEVVELYPDVSFWILSYR